MTSGRATFLLIHGAWHGGWCWDRVADRLRAAGNVVFAPTLKGLSDRADELDPSVGLETHVSQLVDLCSEYKLEKAILCGHSYGGMVISELASRQSHRFQHLVYLDALLPVPGQSAMDMMTEAGQQAVRDQIKSEGDGWLMPPRSTEALGIVDPEDAAWVAGKLTPMPLKCFEEPARLAKGLPEMPKTYLLAEQNCPSVFEKFYNAIGGQSGWTRASLPAGHDAMITHPEDVAEFLLEIAHSTAG